MRAIYAILAALLAGLALAGLLTPVWVLVVTALAGIVRPNDLVMRNSLIGETIPPDHLMGALGMSRATMDSARVGGALAGAGLSTMLGVGLTYVAVTALYVASRALTFGVAQRRPAPRGSSRWRELEDGAFLINLTAYPVSAGCCRTSHSVCITWTPRGSVGSWPASRSAGCSPRSRWC